MKKIMMFIMCLLLIGCTPQVKQEENTNIIIKNDYFSIELPYYWQGHYVYETINDEMGYALVLYETTSYQSEYGGHIMTFSLYTNEEDYSFLPSYDKIGTLKNNEVQYDFVIEYPTDVQFSEETKEAYSTLLEDTEEVLESIKALNDFEFTKGS